jgi:hypothetical protein
MSLLNSAFLTVAKSNAAYFPESQSNDLVIGAVDDTQKILVGIADNPSIMKISNSNISIGGSFTAEMIAVGGQIIGTGTTVVFSPISTGWAFSDDTDPSMGIGIGNQRVQFQNSFPQWSNTTTMYVSENQSYNSNTIGTTLGFQYNNMDIQEYTYTRDSVSIFGKQISQDFVLSSSSDKFLMTGPAGLFSIGFDFVSTNTIAYDESLVFRCYFNKKTDNIIFQNYYSIKGSQFINVMLPSYTQLVLRFFPEDNVGKSFILDTSTKLRITRSTIIEN